MELQTRCIAAMLVTLLVGGAAFLVSVISGEAIGWNDAVGGCIGLFACSLVVAPVKRMSLVALLLRGIAVFFAGYYGGILGYLLPHWIAGDYESAIGLLGWNNLVGAVMVGIWWVVPITVAGFVLAIRFSPPSATATDTA